MIVTKHRPVLKRHHIGPVIRKMRLERSMTLDDLAARAGISASHLSRLERNQTLPSFTVLAGIARVLGVSVDEFAKLETAIEERDELLKARLDELGWKEYEIEAAIGADEDLKAVLYDTFVNVPDRVLRVLNGGG